MSLHKKHRIRRWSIRIILMIILLPITTLVIVRYGGWLRMRKSDREIKAILGPHQVSPVIDTMVLSGRNFVYLKTSKEPEKEGALIFVHGSPGSIDAYLDYMADTALLSRVDLIVYDRPGFGNSDFGISEPSLLKQGEILFGLMKSLPYKRYWLVGHSYGAPVLLQTTIRHPGAVEGISLIAGSVSPELEPKAVSWRKWIDLPGFREILPISMRVSNEELMSLRQDLILIEDDWDRVDIPVSIIHGTKDALVPFENLNYAKEKLVIADTIFEKIFEGESHFILWTHKQAIVDELVKLIER